MILGFSPQDILKMLTEGLILPFLVLALFYKMSKDHEEYRKESRDREEKLMNHLEKTTESMEKVTDSLEKIEFRMTLIEEKVK